MKRRKKKSSGWRPLEKRRPWAEEKKRALDQQDARFKADSDRQGLWRSCPAALCKRKRACAVDPYRCTKERGENAAAARSKENGNEPPRFAISAKDAAAFIKADVEAYNAGADPQELWRGGLS